MSAPMTRHAALRLGDADADERFDVEAAHAEVSA
jgi:hypothetical protein